MFVWKLCSRIIPVTPKACREADDPVIIGVVRAVPADARLRGLQRSHRLMDALRQLGSQPDPLPADRIKDDGIVHAFADPVSRCVAVQAEEQIAVLRRQRAGIERRSSCRAARVQTTVTP